MIMVSTFADRLRELIGDNSMTEFADIVGLSKQSISAYLCGTRKPKRLAVSAIAQIMSVNPAWLMGYDVDKHSRVTDLPKSVRIPVLGRVAAGIPIDAIEDIVDYEEIPEDLAAKGEYIALQIHGTSMEPRLIEGDVVIVRLQDDVNSGDTAIVMVNGDEATCKKIKKTPEGVMLIGTNPDFEPLFFTNKQIHQLPVKIIGKVVEYRGKM